MFFLHSVSNASDGIAIAQNIKIVQARNSESDVLSIKRSKTGKEENTVMEVATVEHKKQKANISNATKGSS